MIDLIGRLRPREGPSMAVVLLWPLLRFLIRQRRLLFMTGSPTGLGLNLVQVRAVLRAIVTLGLSKEWWLVDVDS